MSRSAIDVLADVLAPHLRLPSGALSAMAARFRPVSYARGQALFPLGRRCRSAVLLDEGLVRAFALDGRGREVNLRFLGPPNVAVALTSLITGEPAEEQVEAVRDVRGHLAPIDALATLPHFDRLMRLTAEQHYLSMERRLLMLRCGGVRERYAFYRRHLDAPIVEGMPDYHVASYLGVSPETLSRAKSRAS